MKINILYQYKYVELFQDQYKIEFDREGAMNKNDDDIVYIPSSATWLTLYNGTWLEDKRDITIDNFRFAMQLHYPQIKYHIEFF